MKKLIVLYLVQYYCNNTANTIYQDNQAETSTINQTIKQQLKILKIQKI